MTSGALLTSTKVEDMEEQLMFAKEKHSDRKQRILSDFIAYFGFDSMLESYWAGCN